MQTNILPILTLDTDVDGILRKACEEAVPSPETSMLLHAMVDTLKATPDALGLAAPQVGVAIRAFVMGTEEQGYIAVLNPRVTERSAMRQKAKEGCLSVPGVRVTKRRPVKVTVQGINAEGAAVKFTCKGIAAAAVCHEIDHLNGLLIA